MMLWHAKISCGEGCNTYSNTFYDFTTQEEIFDYFHARFYRDFFSRSDDVVEIIFPDTEDWVWDEDAYTFNQVK